MAPVTRYQARDRFLYYRQSSIQGAYFDEYFIYTDHLYGRNHESEGFNHNTCTRKYQWVELGSGWFIMDLGHTV